MPYHSSSLSSSWYIFYSQLLWRRSCKTSPPSPVPCICSRETLGDTRCGDVSLRPIPSWKTIHFWIPVTRSMLSQAPSLWLWNCNEHWVLKVTWEYLNFILICHHHHHHHPSLVRSDRPVWPAWKYYLIP